MVEKQDQILRQQRRTSLHIPESASLEYLTAFPGINIAERVNLFKLIST
jgi:hypothetical protein